MRTIVVAIVCYVISTPAANARDKDWKSLPLLVWGTGSALRPVKWGPVSFGTGAQVTYALLQQPRTFSDGMFVGCNDIEPIGTLLAERGIREEDFATELSYAFEWWSSIAGISFRRIDSDSKADIVIGAGSPMDAMNIFQSIGHANIAAELRRGTTHLIKKGVVCLSRNTQWSLTESALTHAKNVVLFKPVLVHEIGHVIGVAHPRYVQGAVMRPSVGVTLWFSNLEIETAVFLYGRSRLVHWP